MTLVKGCAHSKVAGLCIGYSPAIAENSCLADVYHCSMASPREDGKVASELISL